VKDEFIEFIFQFRTISGLDLSHYNRTQIERRLSVFQQKHRLLTLADLIKAIREDSELLNECMRRLTINVTEFFRDPLYWDKLRNYITDIARTRLPLKLWSAGCATGEEAYSLSGMLSIMLPKNCWELMASDLDLGALTTAKAGLYQEKSVKGLDPKYKNLLFNKVDDFYVVKERVRERVSFQKLDLLQDSYPSSRDIILCRNVLIYFKESTKKAVIAKLAQSLNPGGILFVGGSEQIMNPDDYNLSNENVFFYKKK